MMFVGVDTAASSASAPKQVAESSRLERATGANTARIGKGVRRAPQPHAVPPPLSPRKRVAESLRVASAATSTPMHDREARRGGLRDGTQRSRLARRGSEMRRVARWHARPPPPLTPNAPCRGASNAEVVFAHVIRRHQFGQRPGPADAALFDDDGAVGNQPREVQVLLR
jgi:hypothetical protein